METKANYVVVGVFTLVAILAAFGFVYWTAGIGDRGEVATLRIRIPGSASGLGRGSFVLFNGVKVGDVTRVFIDVQNPSAAIADATIDRNTPLTKSTKAVIGIAGLTGQANVELNGGSLQEDNLIDEAEAQGRIAEIEADPSAVTNLLQTAQDIFTRADKVITNLEGFVGASRGPLEQTAKNAQTFSDSLARNAAGIDRFLASVATLSDEVAGVSGRLDGTLASAQGLLDSVDRQKIQTIVANAEALSNDLRSTGSRVNDIATKVDGVVAQADTIVRSFNDTAATVSAVARQSQGTLGRVDGILAGVDPATLRSALANIEQTSRSANTAAANIAGLSERAAPIIDDVGKVTQKFGNRADEIDLLIADAGALAGRLNAASEGVGRAVSQANGILSDAGGAVRKVDGILSGVDAGKVASALDNIEQTSRSANAAAANIRDLSQRATPIIEDVGKVTQKFGNRADEIDGLIADAGALAGRLNTASEGVDRAVSQANSILGSVDPEAVRNSVANIEQAASTANSAVTTFRDAAQTASNVADDVDRVTTAVSARTGQIDQFVADASQLAARLNAASVRVDGILRRTDDLLGSGQAEGLVAEASDTLSAFRRVAETLNGRIGPIADNLTRFSAQGLGDIRSLVQDSQRAVTRIEDAVDDIQRNPQRILSGGDGEVRRFNGRTRR